MELNVFIKKLFEAAKDAGFEAAEATCMSGDSFSVSNRAYPAGRSDAELGGRQQSRC